MMATGMQTEMGHIAGMLEERRMKRRPLQKELAHVGKLLGIVVVVIAVVMIATIILVEDVSGFAAIVDALILGVAWRSRRYPRDCRRSSPPSCRSACSGWRAGTRSSGVFQRWKHWDPPRWLLRIKPAPLRAMR